MPIVMVSENAIAQLVGRKVAMISLLKAWVRIPLPPTEFFSLFSEKRGVYHPNVFSLPPPKCQNVWILKKLATLLV